MRRFFYVFSFSLVLCTFLDTSARAGPSERSTFLPDRTEGEIDGRTAVTILPVKYGTETEILNPAGLEVHLTPFNDPDVELVFPSGSWYKPQRSGHYRYWIQGGWRMSYYSMLLFYAGNPFKGRGMVGFVPIGEAGRVVLPPEEEVAPNLVLRLLHAGSYLEGDSCRFEISRRRPTNELGEGLLMPAGPAIGTLWDERSQSYSALSRSFEVRARQTVEVPLERPEGVAHLVVQLLRHEGARNVNDEHYDVEPSLKRPGGKLPPDVKVLTPHRIYALWYGLVPGPAELTADSGPHYLEPQLFDLLPGKIEHLTGQLRPRPALDVELDLPAAFEEEEALVLELRRLPDGEVVRHHTLPPGTRTHRFERVPSTLLDVELQTSLGSFRKQIDLTEGGDGFVVIDPDLIVLSGTVYYGDDGHPAKLTFATVGKTTAKAQADEDGSYEVVLLKPMQHVSIELEGVKRAPYVDVFPWPIEETTELDFHLPDAEFIVEVLDATTGEGIPQAVVYIRNIFSEVEGEAEAGQRDSGMEGKKAICQTVPTDESGVASLPPLREGRLEMEASAEGYSELVQPVNAVIMDSETDQLFEVLLEPIGETLKLWLNLPNGSPASGAEVYLVDSLVTGNGPFSSRANEEGLVEPPRAAAGGYLLIKHPAAAFLIREWRPREGEAELNWDLPAASDRPLLIHVKDAWGEDAVPNAELALWVNGLRLSGRTLVWLTGTGGRADPNGFWTVTNLPRDTVAVLAWELDARDEAYAGSLDSQAVEVEYPWPAPVEIRAIQ